MPNQNQLINFDDFEKGRLDYKNHFLLPQQAIRALIFGCSGSGKTQLLLNLIVNPNIPQVGYDKLFVYSKSLEQPKYKLLQKAVKTIEELHGVKIGYFYKNDVEMLSPKDLNPNERNLIVLDDCMLDSQNKIGDYFCMGRHSGCQCFYLAQSYYKVPLQTVRNNCNFLIMFNVDDRDLQSIHQSHVGRDISFKEFQEFYDHTMKEPYSFVVIDKTKPPEAGKYRVGFDTFFIPPKFTS